MLIMTGFQHIGLLSRAASIIIVDPHLLLLPLTLLGYYLLRGQALTIHRTSRISFEKRKRQTENSRRTHAALYAVIRTMEVNSIYLIGGDYFRRRNVCTLQAVKTRTRHDADTDDPISHEHPPDDRQCKRLL